MKNLFKIFITISMLIAIVGCSKKVETSEEPKEEIVEVQEPTTFIVEVTDLQKQILDNMSLDVLNGLDNGNTYEIPLDDKDKVLESLNAWFDADCLEIWADNDYLEKVYHSKDYQLFKIYFKDNSINTQDAFTTQYAKKLFEYGLIYKKFDSGDNAWVFITFYDANGTKIKQIDSDMLDLQ